MQWVDGGNSNEHEKKRPEQDTSRSGGYPSSKVIKTYKHIKSISYPLFSNS